MRKSQAEGSLEHDAVLAAYCPLHSCQVRLTQPVNQTSKSDYEVSLTQIQFKIELLVTQFSAL